MIRKVKPKRQPRKIVVISSKVECEQAECNPNIQPLTLSDKMKRAIKCIEARCRMSIEELYCLFLIFIFFAITIILVIVTIYNY